jgi:hypothetical protein
LDPDGSFDAVERQGPQFALEPLLADGSDLVGRGLGIHGGSVSDDAFRPLPHLFPGIVGGHVTVRSSDILGHDVWRCRRPTQ